MNATKMRLIFQSPISNILFKNNLSSSCKSALLESMYCQDTKKIDILRVCFLNTTLNIGHNCKVFLISDQTLLIINQISLSSTVFIITVNFQFLLCSGTFVSFLVYNVNVALRGLSVFCAVAQKIHTVILPD